MYSLRVEWSNFSSMTSTLIPTCSPRFSMSFMLEKCFQTSCGMSTSSPSILNFRGGGCFSIVCDLQNVFNSMSLRKVNNGAPFHAIATITVPNVLHVLFLCAGGGERDPGGAPE